MARKYIWALEANTCDVYCVQCVPGTQVLVRAFLMFSWRLRQLANANRNSNGMIRGLLCRRQGTQLFPTRSRASYLLQTLMKTSEFE
eukprot:scaffold102544_cov29-Prasinocladus_malaysianus.AAC.1